jgi:ABC-type enterochelin transport system permease subunit
MLDFRNEKYMDGESTRKTEWASKLALANTLVFSITSFSIRRIVLEKIPLFGISIVIAESFYKFHSFTLELLAFMGTWLAPDIGVQILQKELGRAKQQKQQKST